MGDFLAGLRNVLGPILGQQPIAQTRIGQTPIYQGASGGTDLGSTFKNLTNSGSTITLQPGSDQSPAILKHELIHSLINKHGVDPSKLNFQDPAGQHFKDNVDPKEQISYALAGPGNTPEIKSAMEKAILSSKDVPQGFKDDLSRAGLIKGTPMADIPNPPQYNPNLPPPGYEPIGATAKTKSGLTLPPGYEPYQDSRIMSHTPETQASPLQGKEAVPFYGRLAAQALPMIGSMVEPGLGTAAGYSLSTLLKGASPGIFGQPDQNLTDFAKGLGVNLLTQDVAPAALGYVGKKVLSSLPAVKEGTANLLSKSLATKFGGKTESGLLEKAAGEAADTHSGLSQIFDPKTGDLSSLSTPKPSEGFLKASPGTKAAYEGVDKAFEKNSVGNQLLNLKDEATAGSDVAKAQQYHTISDQMYSDLTHVRNAKLVADPGTVAEVGYHKLLGSSEGPIDAPGILKELAGKKSEIYSEGLGSNLPEFKDALGEIAKQQKVGAAGRLLNYAGHHLVWTGVATGGIGLVSHPAAAVAGGAVLTNAAFSKLMSSEYAPVVVAALKTPAGSPQAAVINQFMAAAIKSIGGLATTPEK